MGSPLKKDEPSVVFFIRSQGKNHQDIFNDSQDRRFFIALLKDLRLKYNTTFLAYVLLKNQYALLIKTPWHTRVQVIHFINSGYANFYNRHHRRSRRLFQLNYTNCLIEESHYLCDLSLHLHLLPNRHNETGSLLRYQWSSLPGYIDKNRQEDWIDYAPILRQFNSEEREPHLRYKDELLKFLREKPPMLFNEKRIESILGSPEFQEQAQKYLSADRDKPAAGDMDLARKIKQTVYAQSPFPHPISRNAAIYLIHRYTGLNNQQISLLFKPLKKSSVSQMRRRFRIRLESEPDTKRIFTDLNNEVNQIISEERSGVEKYLH
ncbi:transposase [Acidobacteriota bacterium]